MEKEAHLAIKVCAVYGEWFHSHPLNVESAHQKLN